MSDEEAALVMETENGTPDTDLAQIYDYLVSLGVLYVNTRGEVTVDGALLTEKSGIAIAFCEGVVNARAMAEAHAAAQAAVQAAAIAAAQAAAQAAAAEAAAQAAAEAAEQAYAAAEDERLHKTVEVIFAAIVKSDYDHERAARKELCSVTSFSRKYTSEQVMRHQLLVSYVKALEDDAARSSELWKNGRTLGRVNDLRKSLMSRCWFTTIHFHPLLALSCKPTTKRHFKWERTGRNTSRARRMLHMLEADLKNNLPESAVPPEWRVPGNACQAVSREEVTGHNKSADLHAMRRALGYIRQAIHTKKTPQFRGK